MLLLVSDGVFFCFGLAFDVLQGKTRFHFERDNDGKFTAQFRCRGA
jgi:hypothetical protein